MKRNLALGKKVSNLAKGNYVTDGDTEQYDGQIGFGECSWPCDVIRDLEEVCIIDTINLYLWDKDNRFYYYRIYVSKDNKDWMKVSDKSNSPCRGLQSVNVEQKKARYIKVECLYNSNNRGFHIVQIEVFGESETSIEKKDKSHTPTQSDIINNFNVFLSYSTNDKEEADKIYEDIKTHNGKIFLAEKALKPGQDFAEEIKNAIINSDELWIILSPSSLKSDWVSTEWGAAWVLDKPIIPILHRCGPEQLPDRLQKLQCIVLYKVSKYIDEKFSV